MTTFTQLTARIKNFLVGWLLSWGLKEGLVECAIVCVKSWVILRNVHPNYPNRQTLEFRSLCIHYICMHLSNFCKSRGEGSMRMKTLSKFDSDVASKSLFLIQQKPHLNTNRSFVTSLVSKFQLILIRH